MAHSIPIGKWLDEIRDDFTKVCKALHISGDQDAAEQVKLLIKLDADGKTPCSAVLSLSDIYSHPRPRRRSSQDLANPRLPCHSFNSPR